MIEKNKNEKCEYVTESGHLFGDTDYDTGLSLAGTGLDWLSLIWPSLKKEGTIVTKLIKLFACY